MNTTTEVPERGKGPSEPPNSESTTRHRFRPVRTFAAGLAGVLVGAMISAAALGLYCENVSGEALPVGLTQIL